MLRNYLAMRRHRTRLTDCFHAAGLYLRYKHDKTERYIYPKIHDVKLTADYTRYVFTLPNGLDPQTVRKGEYAFYQFYGAQIKLTSDDIKKYVLTIFHGGALKSFRWRYEDFAQSMAGLRLPVYCGKDAYGQHVTYDMADAPHLLIAGETGSGKSTQVRSILTTLILTQDPQDIEIYLGDLKRSEFHLFRHVAHVKSLDVTADALLSTLRKLRRLLTTRGALLDANGAANVVDLPAALRPPTVLLCIDEVALLKGDKSALEIIEEISALGRALGVYLILSMQRPDAKVLDGKLKVNLTVRMGFRTADAINARIIGTRGAESITLAERGKYVFKHETLTELQAPLLTLDDAVKTLTPFYVTPDTNVHATEENAVIGRTEAPTNTPSKSQQIFGLLDGKGGGQNER
ncbi:cell division protein FtsK [Geomicrobium sp. JCM 19037]|uniref:FtsK/SpoIIIE domain-containing protein n=1 Tax=Geomicrobium sp. JCM 19037 TaxID=1460634 RepID=UPI00045F2B70|nr:FtsK/SpoIIIE domain-containing protein [Geomicrobium sp. JCM 19037]GAK02296.1 cell division protein FtsK [Geomicrobium sp. JCM 19037]